MFSLSTVLNASRTVFPRVASPPTRCARTCLPVSQLPRHSFALSTLPKTHRVVVDGRRFCSQKSTPPSGGIIINQNPQGGSRAWIWGEFTTGTKVVVTGGGIITLLVASIAAYLYCENNTDKEFCDTVRTYMRIKKK